MAELFKQALRWNDYLYAHRQPRHCLEKQDN